MSSEEGQKHIYAQEHQLYYYYNNFKGLLTFNFNYVFQKATTLDIIINGFRLFIHWLLVSGLKCILARWFVYFSKIRHNAR